jgi:hypothetical protein
MKTSNSVIIVVFQVTNVSSRSERNPLVCINRYNGFLDDILECDFKSFELVMFDVKWCMLRMNEHDTNRIVNKHSNRFTMVNRRNTELGSEPYVLPSQRKQVL